MILIITAILAFSAPSFASSNPKKKNPGHRGPSSVSEITDRLVAFYRKRIVILDRELTTFHYSGRPINPEFTKEKAFTKMGEGAARFFGLDVAEHSFTEGPGIYLAVDPAASRGFGYATPSLYVLNLKKGARLLDDKMPLSISDDKEFRGILNDAQCAQSDAYGTIIQLRGNDLKDCRESVIEAIKQLNLDGIIYDFPGSRFVKGCRYSRNYAINLISMKSTRLTGMFFAGKSFLDDQSLVGSYRELFLEARPDYILTSTNGAVSFEPNLVFPQVRAGSSYETWKADQIAGCGRPWAFETANPYAKFQYQRGQHADLTSLIEAADSAYRKTYEWYDAFDVAKVKAVENLLYPGARDKWDALRITQNFDEALSRVGLTNPRPGTTPDMQLAEALKNPHSEDVKTIYRKIGWSETASEFLAEQFFFALGKAPNANVISILTHCRDLYLANKRDSLCEVRH